MWFVLNDSIRKVHVSLLGFSENFSMRRIKLRLEILLENSYNIYNVKREN